MGGVHTLRHSCATFLFTREGLNAKQVQAWLGHHSASFTLDRVHLLADDLPEPTGFDALGGGTPVVTRPPRSAETRRSP